MGTSPDPSQGGENELAKANEALGRTSPDPSQGGESGLREFNYAL